MSSASEAAAQAESECEKRLRENPELQPLCGAEICAEARETEIYRRSCEGRSIYAPVQVLGCYNPATNQWIWAPPNEIRDRCQQKAKEDPNWELEQCFCCCWAIDGATVVAVAAETGRPISEIDKGDTVLAGRVAAGRVEWSPATVAFSQGTSAEDQPDTVRIALDRGEPLTVSPDQPLMRADGTLTTAAGLVPGQRLMGVDGDPVVVEEAQRGGHRSAVHHIATGQDWKGSPDGHLIQANGVVLGDFTLLLHYPELASATAEV